MTDYFDWEYYLNKYKDLQKAQINTKAKTYAHWLKHGIREDRICNKIFENFNLVDYVKKNKLRITNKETIYSSYYKAYLKKEENNIQSSDLLNTISKIEPIVEPTLEQIVEPTLEQIVEPTLEQIVEPTLEQIIEPTLEQTIDDDKLIEEQIDKINNINTDIINTTDSLNINEEIIEPIITETQKLSKRQQKKIKKLEVIE
jgi:hypothetical protein